MTAEPLTRRQILRGAASFGALAALERLAPAYARTDAAAAAFAPGTPHKVADGAIELAIDHLPVTINGRVGHAVAVNGTVPGPLVRVREGQEAIIRVTNRLDEMGSIHWHGVVVPADMDGVPGISFAGIPPRSTYTYRFPVCQSGTYWAHAHDAHELVGVYFPFVIDPIEPEPFAYDCEYVVTLSDWSFEAPGTIMAKLKADSGYYNVQRRTVGDFFADVRQRGWSKVLADRLDWARMRMDPTDFADVTGHTYTYLLNGLAPDANWSGVFKPGERVRLRCINAGAMTYFDLRIPDLKMTVVQADGQNVKPVEVDEFRIAPGETYDVIVQPDDRAYTVFAETLDRSGYARGTLAPRAGMSAPIPPRRSRPLRTMADIGMGEGASGVANMKAMEGMSSMRAMEGMVTGPSLPGGPPSMHNRDTHGPGNSAVPMMLKNRLNEPGDGLGDIAGKVLVYTDLQSG